MSDVKLVELGVKSGTLSLLLKVTLRSTWAFLRNLGQARVIVILRIRVKVQSQLGLQRIERFSSSIQTPKQLVPS